MHNITVKTIIAGYLKDNGYGGLVDGEGCGCPIDDLFLCDDYCGLCYPGYVHMCDECEHEATCTEKSAWGKILSETKECPYSNGGGDDD